VVCPPFRRFPCARFACFACPLFITSQLPVEHGQAYLSDPTLADAYLDRALHSAHKLALAGESLRKTE